VGCYSGFLGHGQLVTRSPRSWTRVIRKQDRKTRGVLLRTWCHIGSRHGGDRRHGCARSRKIAAHFYWKSCSGILMNYKKNRDHHNTHVMVYPARWEQVSYHVLARLQMLWDSESLDRTVHCVGRSRRGLVLTSCPADTCSVRRGGSVFRGMQLRHRAIKRS
jgi:hypothetical protein